MYSFPPLNGRDVVLAPNQRAARYWANTLAREAGEGATLPHVLAQESWFETLWGDLRASALGDDLPTLLSSAQCEALWLSVLQEPSLSGESSAHSALDAVLEAWTLDQRFGGLASGHLRVELQSVANYGRWRSAFTARLDHEGWITLAQVPHVLAGALESTFDERRLWEPVLAQRVFRLPSLRVEPACEQMFEALQRFGVVVEKLEPPGGQSSETSGQVFPSLRDEWRAAAAFAKAHLDKGAERIGIVVPQLAKHREAVQTIFESVLSPHRQTEVSPAIESPVNVSIGIVLARVPWVDAALLVLKARVQPLPVDEAARLLQSPYLNDAAAQFHASVWLRAAIESGQQTIDLRRANQIALPEALHTALTSAGGPATRAMHDWVALWFERLITQSPLGRLSLDSYEYQARRAFASELESVATLQALCPPCTEVEAVARLSARLRRALFQPQAGGARVQVVGLIESLNLPWDALWVSGLSVNELPQPPRANAYLPLAWQRAAGSLKSDAARTQEAAQVLTLWRASASTVQFSVAATDGHTNLVASPILAWTGAVSDTPAAPWTPPARLEKLTETLGAERAAGPVAGGVRSLASQGQCAFQGYAVSRFSARSWPAGVEGLSASVRGTLVHQSLAALWRQWQDAATLQSRSGSQREADIEAAVAAAIRGERSRVKVADWLWRVEALRLQELLREWINFESGREDFQVTGIETLHELALEDLAFRVRLDRVDRLTEGALIVDYKTGSPTSAKRAKTHPRLATQLPLYALALRHSKTDIPSTDAAHQPIAAVGFAQVRGGACRLDPLPVNEAQLGDWQVAMEALAHELKRGEAAVSPAPQVCRACGLQALCRVPVRLSDAALELDEDDNDPATH